jgi:hypothetical protein
MPADLYVPLLILRVLLTSTPRRNSKDSFKVGTKTVVVENCDLRGDITLGSGALLSQPSPYPLCTLSKTSD